METLLIIGIGFLIYALLERLNDKVSRVLGIILAIIFILTFATNASAQYKNDKDQFIWEYDHKYWGDGLKEFSKQEYYTIGIDLNANIETIWIERDGVELDAWIIDDMEYNEYGSVTKIVAWNGESYYTGITTFEFNESSQYVIVNTPGYTIKLVYWESKWH